MKLTLSVFAEQDLEEIDLQTIDLFGLNQAVRTTTEFDKAFALIRENPKIGHSRKDLSPKNRPLRSWPVLGRFMIIYEVADKEITIERILDGTRDLKSIFLRGQGEV